MIRGSVEWSQWGLSGVVQRLFRFGAELATGSPTSFRYIQVVSQFLLRKAPTSSRGLSFSQSVITETISATGYVTDVVVSGTARTIHDPPDTRQRAVQSYDTEMSYPASLLVS